MEPSASRRVVRVDATMGANRGKTSRRAHVEASGQDPSTASSAMTHATVVDGGALASAKLSVVAVDVDYP